MFNGLADHARHKEQTMDPKTLVVTAISELFGARDLTAIDRWFSPDYIQHSALAGPGIDGLRTLAAALPEGFSYEPARVLSEGDLVVLHGTYRGFGPEPLAAFDLFRVADGRVVEHWDALTPVVTPTASGHTQTDGPTTITEPHTTAANKALIERFVRTILVDGDMSQLATFFDGDAYIQHNPQIPDFVSGLGTALGELAAQGITMHYTKRYRTVAEGEFVFTQSEGTFGGQPYAFYDLFRVDHGFVAEHWDVMVEQPAHVPHDNGLF
jgi:predicted SnoaL-like aldol condensation-catalyzing enzyme